MFDHLLSAWFKLFYEAAGIIVVLLVLIAAERVVDRANKRDETLENRDRGVEDKS